MARGWRGSIRATGLAVAVACASTGVYDAVRALGEDVWLREAGYLNLSTLGGRDRVGARPTVP